MKPLSFFIVYHDRIFRENTSDFTDGELKEFFKWVAVNEKVVKEFPTWTPILLKEWEMNIHSPFYQMLNFYQNSVFYHLAWNKELIDAKYIGFGQYDMKISAPEFREMYETIRYNLPDKIIAPFLYDFQALFCSPINMDGWITLFLNPYNKFFETTHTMKSISEHPLALLHTFIMPTHFFLEIMPFIEKLTPEILRVLGWETRHLAGTLERIFALCISCGILEQKLNLFHLAGFQHIEDQHSEDKLRGIKAK